MCCDRKRSQIHVGLADVGYLFICLCKWNTCIILIILYITITGANEVIGANYTVTTPFYKPLLIFSSN
jgi:hypothetical protein